MYRKLKIDRETPVPARIIVARSDDLVGRGLANGLAGRVRKDTKLLFSSRQAPRTKSAEDMRQFTLLDRAYPTVNHVYHINVC